VLNQGRVAGELTEQGMTEENIMMLAAGIQPQTSVAEAV
jgi:hypothetical protein